MVRIHIQPESVLKIETQHIFALTALLFLVESCAFIFPGNANFLIVTAAIRTLDLAAISAFIYYFKLNRLFFNKKLFLQGIVQGILVSGAVGVLFFASFFLIIFFLNFNLINLLNSNTLDGEKLFLLIVAGGIISPVAEEFFFRGFIYKYLRQYNSIFFAVVSSSLIFALFHLNAGYMPVIQFAGGIFFALAFELSKNIYVPVTIHITGNIFIFTAPFINKFIF